MYDKMGVFSWKNKSTPNRWDLPDQITNSWNFPFFKIHMKIRRIESLKKSKIKPKTTREMFSH